MKGFSALILIVLVGALLAGASFLYRQSNVKGASTTSEVQESGFVVSIISKSETWDLSLYGCKSESECLTSLDSGKRLSRVSGGATEMKEIKYTDASLWKDYSWLKAYAKPGMAKAAGVFGVLSVGDVPGSYSKKLGSVEAVLLPVNVVLERFYHSATLSDR